MSKEYLCLRCVHLKPGKMDLLECELQSVRFLNDAHTKWTFDPVCIHDADVGDKSSTLPDKFSPVTEGAKDERTY